jgi:plastocyanin
VGIRSRRRDGVRRRAGQAFVVVLLAAAAGGCARSTHVNAGPPTTLPPNSRVVRVANFAFTPQTLTISAGQTVVWEFNQPDAPHNVVSLSGPVSFNSGVPQGRGTFSFTFTQPGTYAYDCQVHPDMTGTVVVTQTSSPG